MTKAFEVLADARDTDNWLEARKHLLTASDVAAVLGRNPWKSPLMVFNGKTGRSAPLEDNAKLRAGRFAEPSILLHYRHDTGRQTKPVQKLCRSVKHPWLGATCDAWAKTESGVDVAVEFKNTIDRGNWDEDAPEVYQIQNQAQVLVMGAPMGSLAALLDGWDFRFLDSLPDKELHEEIVEVTHDFWHNHVLKDEPPPATAMDKDALEDLYPKEDGTVIELAEGWVEADRRILEIKRQVKALTAEQKELEVLMREAIGEHTAGVLPCGAAYKWTTVERKGYTVEPTSYRKLARVKALKK